MVRQHLQLFHIGQRLQVAPKGQQLLPLEGDTRHNDMMEKLEVLPYHSMGKVKYDSLGIEYPLLGTPQLSKAEAAQAEAIRRGPFPFREKMKEE